MIFCIDGVLTLQERELVVSQLEAAEFIDGKATAGWHAQLVKHNTQLKRGAAPELDRLIGNAIQRHPLFQMAVRPKTIRAPLFSRYTVGMSYGTHIDNAIMGADLMRSDVSLTLFLNPPDDYEGGELVIEDTQGTHPFKLKAGAMIVYPSSTLHRVEPVTQGMRLVAVTWVQSLVRDPIDREILFDLDTARQSIFQKYGKSAEFDLLAKSHANLLRRWAEL